jgi:hypothetical protein
VFGIFRGKSKPSESAESPRGMIVRRLEDGLPVVLRLVNEFPAEPVRVQLQWLTVIAWKYDGSSRNGMPPPDLNQEMVRLEDAIEGLERPAFMQHAYSRTGNGLKEFAYYINDRDAFIEAFNAALKSHAPYPISIDFYSDPEWKDFKAILESIAESPRP